MLMVRGYCPALLELSMLRRLNSVLAPRSRRIHSPPAWFALVVQRLVDEPSRALDAVPADAVAVHPVRSAANSPSGDIQSSWVSQPPTLVPRRLMVLPVPELVLSTLPLALMKSAAVIGAAWTSVGGLATVVTSVAATRAAASNGFFMVLLDHPAPPAPAQTGSSTLTFPPLEDFVHDFY